jgi:ABC-2 type transport system permease protein
MKKIRAIAKKDLLQIMRDREGYIWLLIMPIVFMVALSFATAPMYRAPDDKGTFEVSFLLVNQDSGSLAQKLVKQIGKVENLKPIAEIDGEALTAARARQLVDQEDYRIALIIPDNFTSELNAGEMIEMEMYRDPATTMQAGLLRKIVEGVDPFSFRISCIWNSAR